MLRRIGQFGKSCLHVNGEHNSQRRFQHSFFCTGYRGRFKNLNVARKSVSIRDTCHSCFSG